MMTLDEAITHAEWCADNSCGECADDHRQLAEWLKELRQWQKLVEGIDLRPASLMKPFQPNVNDLERENDMLKAENAKMMELVRELYEDAFMEYPSHFAKTYLSRLTELGIEVDE